MKDLALNEDKTILKRFRKNNNFFLCNNYSKTGFSYCLCNNADLIISVPTSLAEESIAIGKKVIFINDFYTINNLSKAALPNEYNFAIAKDNNELINLSKKIINNDEYLKNKYKFIKSELNYFEKNKKFENFSQLVESILE